MSAFYHIPTSLKTMCNIRQVNGTGNESLHHREGTAIETKLCDTVASEFLDRLPAPESQTVMTSAKAPKQALKHSYENT